jgi:hypothetical protein
MAHRRRDQDAGSVASFGQLLVTQIPSEALLAYTTPARAVLRRYQRLPGRALGACDCTPSPAGTGPVAPPARAWPDAPPASRPTTSNGEVVLLGRLHTVATPVSALLQRLANRLAHDRGEPASITPDEFDQLLARAAHPA